MRRMVILFAVALAGLAASAGTAAAKTQTVAVLITISRTADHHVDWDVMGNQGKPLGSATEMANRSGSVWSWNFKLAHGTIRTTWYFSRNGKSASLSRAPITGGSGRYAGASGSVSASGVLDGRLTKNLDQSSIQVVFHIS
jgi:hypothetical protein